VSAELSPAEVKQYDMLCIFTPAGVQSLFNNVPDYEQGDQQLAIFGPSAQPAAEAKGFRIDVKAPTEECPSMPAALRDFLLKNNE
jgi:uroporphyrinogen-III synthase